MTTPRSSLARTLAGLAFLAALASPAAAQQQPYGSQPYTAPPQPQPYQPQQQYQPRQGQGQNSTYSTNELVAKGHSFFGTVSKGLALSIEKAVSQWGQPNGYILGQEGTGAFVGGLRYGEGTLYTRNAGDLKVYWQGPSIGWDFGGDGGRTMILVYNLRTVDDVFRRFGGVTGSAYFVAGFGMTALTADDIVVVPIRSGVGVRLGANLGYLKFTPQPTWNPF
ncbi:MULTISPECIES: DUF1134 domain-containing protein [Azorhizobium]|uniref:Uncharacterized conserved protein n=1 Tax=Azorhizobium caulinodans (strain ATCC 43989 / DSM 5975 / JCM 20966 / LMG 6465 / NBRC 14845 / NCIMB 13405 / ORS 571) TaxID=438753 RepID=A8HQZ8_AZOC5|nr:MULTISPECIES: DUF1134 domain-containing protein [Azorhizobium]TDT92714.1 hypothetical protein DFO45_3475 [Azorhizobium sp. AG788]BAF87079.1 uncharacterized conserved protein [Azorhizobium caulinodans ORS 571]